MKLLLLCAILALPAISCGTDYPVTKPSNPCQVIAWPPAPKLTPIDCGEHVCFTLDDTVKLAAWVHDITEVRRDLARCPLVVFRG